MPKLDDAMVARISANLPFLRLAITDANTHSRDEIANFLWQWMRSNENEIDRTWRQEAIEARNRLNGGYTKASH
tara:strand:+ start:869 stop:1090 length:222 start_codon:yes stop_codon:yes gene_type:complete